MSSLEPDLVDQPEETPGGRKPSLTSLTSEGEESHGPVTRNRAASKKKLNVAVSSFEKGKAHIDSDIDPSSAKTGTKSKGKELLKHIKSQHTTSKRGRTKRITERDRKKILTGEWEFSNLIKIPESVLARLQRFRNLLSKTLPNEAEVLTSDDLAYKFLYKASKILSREDHRKVVLTAILDDDLRDLDDENETIYWQQLLDTANVGVGAVGSNIKTQGQEPGELNTEQVQDSTLPTIVEKSDQETGEKESDSFIKHEMSSKHDSDSESNKESDKDDDSTELAERLGLVSKGELRPPDKNKERRQTFGDTFLSGATISLSGKEKPQGFVFQPPKLKTKKAVSIQGSPARVNVDSSDEDKDIQEEVTKTRIELELSTAGAGSSSDRDYITSSVGAQDQAISSSHTGREFSKREAELEPKQTQSRDRPYSSTQSNLGVSSSRDENVIQDEALIDKKWNELNQVQADLWCQQKRVHDRENKLVNTEDKLRDKQEELDHRQQILAEKERLWTLKKNELDHNIKLELKNADDYKHSVQQQLDKITSETIKQHREKDQIIQDKYKLQQELEKQREERNRLASEQERLRKEVLKVQERLDQEAKEKLKGYKDFQDLTSQTNENRAVFEKGKQTETITKECPVFEQSRVPALSAYVAQLDKNRTSIDQPPRPWEEIIAGPFPKTSSPAYPVAEDYGRTYLKEVPSLPSSPKIKPKRHIARHHVGLADTESEKPDKIEKPDKSETRQSRKSTEPSAKDRDSNDSSLRKTKRDDSKSRRDDSQTRKDGNRTRKDDSRSRKDDSKYKKTSRIDKTDTEVRLGPPWMNIPETKEKVFEVPLKEYSGFTKQDGGESPYDSDSDSDDDHKRKKKSDRKGDRKSGDKTSRRDSSDRNRRTSPSHRGSGGGGHDSGPGDSGDGSDSDDSQDSDDNLNRRNKRNKKDITMAELNYRELRDIRDRMEDTGGGGRKKGPGTFSGGPGEDPGKFWRKVVNYWALQRKKRDRKLDWEHKLRLLYENLEGAAETWFVRLSPKQYQNVDKLEKAFFEHFDPSQQKFIKQAVFETRKLQPGETVLAYVNDMKIKAGDLKKNSEELQNALIRGLPDAYKKFVWQWSPKSLEETIARMYIAEATVELPPEEDKPKAIPSVRLSMMGAEENKTEVSDNNESALQNLNEQMVKLNNMMTTRENKLENLVTKMTPSNNVTKSNNGNNNNNQRNNVRGRRMSMSNNIPGCFLCGSRDHWMKFCPAFSQIQAGEGQRQNNPPTLQQVSPGIFQLSNTYVPPNNVECENVGNNFSQNQNQNNNFVRRGFGNGRGRSRGMFRGGRGFRGRGQNPGGASQNQGQSQNFVNQGN